MVSPSQSAPVQMYATSWCPYCERARQLLSRKGVRFEEIDLDLTPARREEMIRRSGRRTVPQIFIGERHIGGSDELYELEVAGMLDGLLRASTEPMEDTHDQ
jgi:glutaredoxin 3